MLRRFSSRVATTNAVAASAFPTAAAVTATAVRWQSSKVTEQNPAVQNPEIKKTSSPKAVPTPKASTPMMESPNPAAAVDGSKQGLGVLTGAAPDPATGSIPQPAEYISTVDQQAHQNLCPAVSYQGLTGGQIVYQKLREHQSDSVFLYSGGAVMPLIDAFHEGDIKYYINAHEQMGGHSATGFAKVSGKVGVCVVTSGPALTNCITPITDAQNDSTPFIVISGQVPLNKTGTNAFQDCPATDITRPVTKWSYKIKSIDEISAVIDKAFRIALDGKAGAVHIDLPKCISSSKNPTEKVFSEEEIFGEVDNKPNPALSQPVPIVGTTAANNSGNTITATSGLDMTNFPSILKGEGTLINMKQAVASLKADRKTTMSAEEIKKVLDVMASAKKPIILCGKGANPASALVRRLVEATGFPVTTTIHAMGVVDERYSEHCLPFMGMHGSAVSNYAIQEADMILNLGSRFDDRITGDVPHFAPKARAEGAPGIIHVNIHKPELNFVIETQHNFAMDCGDFLSAIVGPLEAKAKAATDKGNKVVNGQISEWWDKIHAWKAAHPFKVNYFPNALSTQEVIFEMNQVLQENRSKTDGTAKDFLITTGVGNHQMMAAQFIDWVRPGTFITSGSLGVMGTGLPYSIGVQVAKPNEMVVNIDGDGSFNMSLSELKTVMEYNLPVRIAIMNDGELSMVKAWEKLFYEGRHVATKLEKNPDYVTLAESFGMKAIRCADRDALPGALQEFLSTTYEGPILADFRVQSDLCLPLVKPGAPLHEMILERQDEPHDIDTSLPPS